MRMYSLLGGVRRLVPNLGIIERSTNMFFCDITRNGKAYRVTVTVNETVTGVIEKGIQGHSFDSCVVYDSDGKTVCDDLYIRKRISDVAKRHIDVRLAAINTLLNNNTT